MGDYTKLVVIATISSKKKDIKAQLKRLELRRSSYHSPEKVVSIKKNPYDDKLLDVVIVGQTKYAIGQKRFLEWIGPLVVQGSGVNDLYAIQINENGLRVEDGITFHIME